MNPLIRGRNNEAWVGVEPSTLRSWSSQKRRSEPLGHAADKWYVTLVSILQNNCKESSQVVLGCCFGIHKRGAQRHLQCTMRSHNSNIQCTLWMKRKSRAHQVSFTRNSTSQLKLWKKEKHKGSVYFTGNFRFLDLRKQLISDRKQIVWVWIVREIFPSTAYVKNWMEFCTTTNRIKIVFSVNRFVITRIWIIALLVEMVKLSAQKQPSTVVNVIKLD